MIDKNAEKDNWQEDQQKYRKQTNENLDLKLSTS